jgi:hypothetical protein
MVLTFLKTEQILTLGAITGIFTASLLTSLKLHILEPLVERFLPIEHLRDQLKCPPVPPPKPPDSNESQKYSKQNFSNIESLPVLIPDKLCAMKSGYGAPHNIKWELFLRELLLWIIIVGIIYIGWKFYKKTN